MNLLVQSPFRATSNQEKYVIAGMVPMGLLVSQVRCLYEEGRINITEKHTKSQRVARLESLKRCNNGRKIRKGAAESTPLFSLLRNEISVDAMKLITTCHNS